MRYRGKKREVQQIVREKYISVLATTKVDKSRCKTRKQPQS